MLNFKRQKRGMSISIVLLTILTLVLVVTALLMFNLRSKRLEEKLYVSRGLDRVYARAAIFDFYLNEILDKIGEDASIEEFNTELEKYKDDDGDYFIKELEQVEDKNFEILFEERVFIKKEKFLDISYNHKFEYKG